jgi:hypothetical protein
MAPHLRSKGRVLSPCCCRAARGSRGSTVSLGHSGHSRHERCSNTSFELSCGSVEGFSSRRLMGMGVRARLPSRGLPQGAGGGARESEEAALARRSCPEDHPLTNQALIHFDAPSSIFPQKEGYAMLMYQCPPCGKPLLGAPDYDAAGAGVAGPARLKGSAYLRRGVRESLRR